MNNTTTKTEQNTYPNSFVNKFQRARIRQDYRERSPPITTSRISLVHAHNLDDLLPMPKILGISFGATPQTQNLHTHIQLERVAHEIRRRHCLGIVFYSLQGYSSSLCL